MELSSRNYYGNNRNNRYFHLNDNYSDEHYRLRFDDMFHFMRRDNERERLNGENNNRRNNYYNEGIQNIIIPYPNSEPQNNDSKKDSKLEEENLQKKFNDISKCQLCKGKIERPVMCKSCLNISCKECIDKLLLSNRATCGFCNGRVNSSSYVEVPFMEYVWKFLELYQKNKVDNENLAKTNENLFHDVYVEKCEIHNEKIIYYCFNCTEKLCGKCLSISNESAKIHQNHKIYDYNKVKISEYKDLIEKIKEIKKLKIQIDKEKFDSGRIKNNVEIYYKNAKAILDNIYENYCEILNKRLLKISEVIEKFNELSKRIDDSITNITKFFSKIENLSPSFKEKINIKNALKSLENISLNSTDNIKIKSSCNSLNNLIKFNTITHEAKKSIDQLTQTKKFMVDLKISKIKIKVLFNQDEPNNLTFRIKNGYIHKNGISTIFYPILHINEKNYGIFNKKSEIKKTNKKDNENNNFINEIKNYYEMKINLNQIKEISENENIGIKFVFYVFTVE